MTSLDPHSAFDAGLLCGVILGALITGYGALLLWQLRDALQGRMNKPTVREDWPE